MSSDEVPVDAASVRALLGFRRPVPLTLAEMSRSLRVLFVPGTRLSPRLQDFGEKLRVAFRDLGVREVLFQDALTSSGHLVEGVVPLFLGEPQMDAAMLEQLPLQNLYSTQMVGVFDRKSPVDEQSGLQDRLDSIVEVMTGHLVTLCLFVTDEHWCMCTMNGAVANYINGDSITADVERGLIPKLAARVMPPRVSDITCRYEGLDPLNSEYNGIVSDFRDSLRIWAETGLIAAHTSLSRLQFRSPLHRMLVTSYLDDRSGMSYGFLSWQLPSVCEPAMLLDDFGQAWGNGAIAERHGRRWVRVRAGGKEYAVPVPDVSVLCTRSGCRKDQMDPARDLVRLTLSNGKVLMDTPHGITQAEDCRPSYDTFTILGIAVGNCLAASILMLLQPESRFADTLSSDGLSLSHWHGVLSKVNLPSGYIRHGAENPGVCCSTPQSAIYALTGKLTALDMALKSGVDFLGDVHLEPHHGTNLCGVLSLTESSRVVQRDPGEHGEH